MMKSRASRKEWFGCALKKSDNLGNRAVLGGKKAKFLLPPCLYKVACSLDGDSGLLIAPPLPHDKEGGGKLLGATIEHRDDLGLAQDNA